MGENAAGTETPEDRQTTAGEGRRVDVVTGAAMLRAGDLVAFPTETVFGLGANCDLPAAIAALYQRKERPTSHPLIVHFADIADVDRYRKGIDVRVDRLKDRFWPGPLTLVLPAHARVPKEVTGNQSTVAVRVPAHPVARDLLKRVGSPVAAPSANRYGMLSPTRPEHVWASLGLDLPCVAEGGLPAFGIESTILSLAEPHRTVVLRHGAVPVEALEAVLGSTVEAPDANSPRAPGSVAGHYAPRARLLVVPAAEIAEQFDTLSASGERVAAWAPLEVFPSGVGELNPLIRAQPNNPTEQAYALYATLWTLDELRPSVILVAQPPARGVGVAVLDRLNRAQTAGTLSR